MKTNGDEMRKAGRPAKIPNHIKAEILRKLGQGAKPADLQREYRIAESTFRRNFSAEASKVREVATALAYVEGELEQLPIAAQISARTLADYMKSTQSNLAQAAMLGSQTTVILAEKGAKIAQGLAQSGEGFGSEDDIDTLRTINALASTSNESSKIALGMLQATAKGAAEPSETEDKTEFMKKLSAMLPG